MNFNDMCIFTGRNNENEYPRIRVMSSGDNGVVFKISTSPDGYSAIKFFLQNEQELINFKNSVINEVQNYLKGARK